MTVHARRAQGEASSAAWRRDARTNTDPGRRTRARPRPRARARRDRPRLDPRRAAVSRWLLGRSSRLRRSLHGDSARAAMRARWPRGHGRSRSRPLGAAHHAPTPSSWETDPVLLPSARSDPARDNRRDPMRPSTRTDPSQLRRDRPRNHAPTGKARCEAPGECRSQASPPTRGNGADAANASSDARDVTARATATRSWNDTTRVDSSAARPSCKIQRSREDAVSQAGQFLGWESRNSARLSRALGQMATGGKPR